MEDALEQMIAMLAGIKALAQGVQFPIVGMTPIAIFRSL
jgi:hypothetical protein